MNEFESVDKSIKKGPGVLSYVIRNREIYDKLDEKDRLALDLFVEIQNTLDDVDWYAVKRHVSTDNLEKIIKAYTLAEIGEDLVNGAFTVDELRDEFEETVVDD